MYTAHNMYGAVDISQPLIEEYQKDLSGFRSLEEKMMRCTLAEFGLIKSFLISKLYNPGITLRMLEAHGHSTPEGQYYYVDTIDKKESFFSVQDWVQKHDGHYDTLFVNCCNQGRVTLQTKNSLLIYPIGTTPGNEVYQIMTQDKKSQILQITLPTNPKMEYLLDAFLKNK